MPWPMTGGDGAKRVCSLSRGRVPDSSPWIVCFIFYKYCSVYWTTLCLSHALFRRSRTLSAHWRSTYSTPISYCCKGKLGGGLDCVLVTCSAVAWVTPLKWRSPNHPPPDTKMGALPSVEPWEVPLQRAVSPFSGGEILTAQDWSACFILFSYLFSLLK